VLNVANLHVFWNQSLLHPEDYPFLMNGLPGRFTDARIRIELSSKVRPLLPSPLPQNKPDLPRASRLPSVSVSPIIQGGEHFGLTHLNHYFFETKAISTYKFTRNNMLKFLDSSKLSPYLATGALSPRMIYWELKRYEQTVEKNVSTYWLWFELLWRDYFYFLHIKEGDRFFSLSGSSSQTALWEKNATYVHAILHAKTGYPLVDANLIELYQTGWMSNRGRQNVASFISKSLHLDWRWGAALFEHYLLDYDVSSNYGNWQYIAGVGADPRDNRLFNVSLQLKKYDSKGTYIKHWLPVLQNVAVPELYQPWTMNALQQVMYQCSIGKDYPHPIIDEPSIQLR
jgi:deoxyribodipyrimidine photo-lyase